MLATSMFALSFRPAPASLLLPLPAPQKSSGFSDSGAFLPRTLGPASQLSSAQPSLAQLAWIIHRLPHAEALREMAHTIYFLSSVSCTQSFVPGLGWRQAGVTPLGDQLAIPFTEASKATLRLGIN